jgi:hypothetical protein
MGGASFTRRSLTCCTCSAHAGSQVLLVSSAHDVVLLCTLCCRMGESRSAGALQVQKPYGQPQGRLADQQRSIRMGW